MVKKILIGVTALVLLTVAGLFFWSRSVLSSDTVRLAVAAQLTKALGQPVGVGSISATIFPRVTMTLNEVTIGNPVRISAKSLHVGTDFRALLSKKIEHAALKLDTAKIELPLPAFAFAQASEPPTPASDSAPVEIVSVDEVTLSNIDVVSGGRTLHGDIAIVPKGTNALEITRIALKADDTSLEITGAISDLAGPVGNLKVKAGDLNVEKILAFVADFTKDLSQVSPASSATTSTPSASAGARGMHITVALEADRATLNGLELRTLNGTASVTDVAVTLDPVAFVVFGGSYSGSLNLTLDAVPAYRFHAAIKDVDAAAAMKFVGSPDTVTGKIAGTIDLSGKGLTADDVLKTTQGTMRFDATNGTVRNLGLVRSVILATSKGADKSQPSSASATEPFSRFGATLAIANGTASTNDLTLESRDILLSATGSMKLDGSAIALSGPLQLSDELSQQAGRDLVRYTQQGGRVTLPASVSGSLNAPKVRIDLGDLAKRAITNRANEEAQKAVGKGLGRLLGR